MSGQPKYFFGLVRQLGLLDGARILLRELDLATPISIRYPGVRRRFRVRFDPTWKLIGRGIRESSVIRFAEEHIRKGQTVFDIGAHIGEYSLLFSDLVGGKGKVVAFEPDPKARKLLERNVKENGAGNVMVESTCLTNWSGPVWLSTAKLGNGLTSMVLPENRTGFRKKFEVVATPLDSYSEKHNVFPDWVKIDVEGAESLVIKGMAGLIDSRHPSVILEFHGNDMSDNDRRRNRLDITSSAKKIEFLEGDCGNYRYLGELAARIEPDCKYLAVRIRY